MHLFRGLVSCVGANHDDHDAPCLCPAPALVTAPGRLLQVITVQHGLTSTRKNQAHKISELTSGQLSTFFARP